MKFLPTKKKKDEQTDKDSDVTPSKATSDEEAASSTPKKSRFDWKPSLIGKDKKDQPVSKKPDDTKLISESKTGDVKQKEIFSSYDEYLKKTSESKTGDVKQKVLEESLPQSIEKEKEGATDKPLENESTLQDSKTANTDKITKLIVLVSNNKENVINPSINFETNSVSYPILAKIGENESDVSFLEKLSSKSAGILEREIYERLVVCPQHPHELTASVRLYCPECSSMDVERLQLIEHKVCGYIAEKEQYKAVSVTDIKTCPNCKRQIKDYKKEFRMPGRWNRCNKCNKKFDDAIIRLHCRRFNHDFDINEIETVIIPCYKIKSDASENAYALTIIPQLNKILTSLGFAVEELAMVKGKSGMTNPTSIYAHNSENKAVAIFIKTSKNEIEDAEINSIIVKVLDISPTLAIFIGIPSVSERAKAMAAAYGIAIVTEKNGDKIIASVEQILSKEISITANSRMNI